MITERQREILNHAYETVPFYMDMSQLKGLDVSEIEEWKDIPFTQKEDIVYRNDSFISAQALPLYIRGKLICTHTSGSTGKCANVFWEQGDCKRSLLPLWLRRKKFYNINSHDKHCYFFTARAMGQEDVEVEKLDFALGFCKSNLNDEKLIAIWKQMQEYEPIWMNLQPSMAILLGKIVEKYQLERIASLRYIETTGEMLFSENRRFIENIFQVKIANQYGCNELNSIAYECPRGHLHCMDKNVVVEIVDEEGNILPDGEEGDICATTLTNYAMPLIRYRVGDRGRISNVVCSCGEKSKILELTTGRSNDWVMDRDGNQINAYIFARCVENVNKVEEHSILQFQVIQHEIDKFTIHLVLDRDCEQDLVCRCFLDNLWQSSLSGAEFRIQIHSELLPEDRSGKLKWFIRERGCN